MNRCGLSAALLAFGLAALPASVRAEEALPFSPVVEAGGMLYVSGHLPLLPGTRELDGDGIAMQTHRVLKNIDATLGTAGASLDDVVSVTVFLTTMDDFPAFNDAYREHFPGRKPARTTVAVRELAFGSRIEVNCIAVRPGAKP